MAAGDDITEIQSGQGVDAVESLARAMVETAFESATPSQIIKGRIRPSIDGYGQEQQAHIRRHAKLLLERMNR